MITTDGDWYTMRCNDCGHDNEDSGSWPHNTPWRCVVCRSRNVEWVKTEVDDGEADG